MHLPIKERMADIKRNLFYNTLLTSAYYVFPLIVYPYVSRVLGVSNIGLVGFIDSIATYFILFSMMGISILGVREIARCGDDGKKRKSVLYSLLGLHGLTTVITLCIMAAVTFIVPELRRQLPMMGVGMCKLVFNLFLIEWFYKGLEDFKYITLRSIIIRGLYVVSVFIFVRCANDVLTYYFLTMLVVFVTATVNIAGVKRFISPARVAVSLKQYVKPYFSLGAYELLTTAYTTLNVAFLGFASNDSEVGYYTTATKVIYILTMLYASFSGVLLPRMSSFAAEGNMTGFRKYFRRAFIYVLCFSLPLVAIIEVFAPEVIMLLSGPGYEGAILPLRIMIPFLMVFGIEQLVTVQTLMPMGRDKAILCITLAAAISGIVLNIILVPEMGAVGSAIVWACAETLILIFSSFYMLKFRLLS